MADAERGLGAGGASPPRLVTANRRQVELRPFDLESLLAPEHRARATWAMVEGLNLMRC
jgi:hypothetical protein